MSSVRQEVALTTPPRLSERGSGGEAVLVVLLGPTGVGKTELSLQLAEALHCPILNCDSRQLFRDLQIGTAAPTAEQLARVKHYFVGTLGLSDYYSAAQYEQDALALINQLFQTHDTLLLSGGSMLYIDAVCKGIDDIPTVRDDIREAVKQRLATEGLPALFAELQRLDPDYAAQVDPKNTRRVVHALEICTQTGCTYTSFRKKSLTPQPPPREGGGVDTNSFQSRLQETTVTTPLSPSGRGDGEERLPFRILRIGLNRPRAELFARINARVDEMMAAGLLDEVRRLLPYRDLNALNTVGYKELFRVLDGEWELPMAVERIKKNTRVYAKKQLTWFQKDESIHWLTPPLPSPQGEGGEKSHTGLWMEEALTIITNFKHDNNRQQK